MKLLIITAIAEFENEVKQILKKAAVKKYSYNPVTGFRDATEEDVESNWFGTAMTQNESLMFYAYTENENVAIVYDAVKAFNDSQETMSNIHVAILDIEKTN
ncbi:hypothetical protein GCM10022386_02060 [Flavobacterium cheonhonense]|uniref:Uncharacterized protein n=1 Tax=Flavobacterium cheonhonense TaxID=706185 RepID=A0ABP7T8Q1_9FLAO|nr:hypothetical protein [Flavobacterium cheonhonense]